MKFEPWNQFANHVNTEIPVFNPPCKDCHFWNPRIKTDAHGNYDGVSLCTKIGDMMQDFSCYAERIGEKK